jgi:hypothetical protein
VIFWEKLLTRRALLLKGPIKWTYNQTKLQNAQEKSRA